MGVDGDISVGHQSTEAVKEAGLRPDSQLYDRVKAAELEAEQAVVTYHALHPPQQQQQDEWESEGAEGRPSMDIPGVAYNKVTLAQSAVPTATVDRGVTTGPNLAGTSGATSDQLAPEVSHAEVGTIGDMGAGTYSDTLNTGDQGLKVTTTDTAGTTIDKPAAAVPGFSEPPAMTSSAATAPAGPTDAVELESPRARFRAIKAKFERAQAQEQQQQQQQGQGTVVQSPSRKLKKGGFLGSIKKVFSPSSSTGTSSTR
jgi:hypothetical protein